jgi:hypothetical protein
MRCKTVRTKIDDHADGLLPAAEAEAVRDHLDACPPCRDLAFAAKAASASLSQWGDLPLPDGGFDKLLARIDAIPPQALAPRRQFRPTLLRRFAWPAGIAAAAAAAFVVFTTQDLQRGSGSGAAGANGSGGTPVVVATSLPGAGITGTGTTPGNGGLLPGEVYVHRDPDDPRLRRVRTPREGSPVSPDERGPQPVPVKYPSPLGPTYR